MNMPITKSVNVNMSSLPSTSMTMTESLTVYLIPDTGADTDISLNLTLTLVADQVHQDCNLSEREKINTKVVEESPELEPLPSQPPKDEHYIEKETDNV